MATSSDHRIGSNKAHLGGLFSWLSALWRRRFGLFAFFLVLVVRRQYGRIGDVRVGVDLLLASDALVDRRRGDDATASQAQIKGPINDVLLGRILSRLKMGITWTNLGNLSASSSSQNKEVNALDTTMNNGESDHMKTKRIFFDKAVLPDNSIVEMTIWQLPKPSPERLFNVQTMLDTISPRRLELLRHVRKHGANDVRELALVLARDYKNVHQ